MEATQSNPAMALLQQAMELISPKKSIPVVIDYDAITKAAVRTVAEERKKIYNRVLFTQKEAQDTYGKSVINALVKRGFLQQYKFDTREAVDREGNPIIKAKGVIYYRIAEIEKAIEDGNILKGTRRGTI
jgi:hypothetical protein